MRGTLRAEGVLKDFITNDQQLLEFKGKDIIKINNYSRLLVTSNHDWVVPAGLGERRFAVFDVGSEHKEDHKYFGLIEKQLENGGYEALLYHLLNVDLSKVNLRAVQFFKLWGLSGIPASGNV